jgi:hypothetical protein
MKKNIFAFIICLPGLSVKTYSQTLTAANSNPVIGDVFAYATGVYTPQGNGGAGQLWNFSSLTITSSAQSYTMTSPPSQYTSTMFTTSNISRQIGSGPIEFFRTNANGIDFLGNLYPGPPITVIEFSIAQTILAYPFSLNSSNSYIWSYATPNTPPAVVSVTTTIICDGTGTLVTASGTYSNTLRVHTIETYTFLGGSSIANTYKWYTPGIHGELLNIHSYLESSYNGSVTDQGSKIYSPPASSTISTVGLKDNEAGKTHTYIYPNPASDNLFIESESIFPFKILLINSLGQTILETGTISDKNKTIDISTFCAGIYFLQVYSNNELVKQQKVIISR